MGRHGVPTRRRAVPWELVGWGLFAAAVALGAGVWVGASWVLTAVVAAAGLVGLGLIAAMSMKRPREWSPKVSGWTPEPTASSGSTAR